MRGSSIRNRAHATAPMSSAPTTNARASSAASTVPPIRPGSISGRCSSDHRHSAYCRRNDIPQQHVPPGWGRVKLAKTMTIRRPSTNDIRTYSRHKIRAAARWRQPHSTTRLRVAANQSQATARAKARSRPRPQERETTQNPRAPRESPLDLDLQRSAAVVEISAR